MYNASPTLSHLFWDQDTVYLNSLCCFVQIISQNIRFPARFLRPASFCLPVCLSIFLLPPPLYMCSDSVQSSVFRVNLQVLWTLSFVQTLPCLIYFLIYFLGGVSNHSIASNRSSSGSFISFQACLYFLLSVYTWNVCLHLNAPSSIWGIWPFVIKKKSRGIEGIETYRDTHRPSCL